MSTTPELQVRASYTARTLRVYQAYSDAIADTALASGTFVAPPFKLDRMTWIKPSFLWMMYRSGWASKLGQERILGIDILRSGFEWALTNSCLSHFTPIRHESEEHCWRECLASSPVRIQWDPERDIHLNRLPHRTIQVGLRGIAVHHYVHDWIEKIEDLTHHARSIQQLIDGGPLERAASLLPVEKELPLSAAARHAVGIPSGEPTEPS